jgi:hypothetical protein
LGLKKGVGELGKNIYEMGEMTHTNLGDGRWVPP